MGIIETITKMFDFFSKAEDYFNHSLNAVEKRVTEKIERIQKIVMLSVIQGFLFLLGGVAVIAAIAVFLARFLAYEVVFIFIAFLFIYAGVIIGFYKK